VPNNPGTPQQGGSGKKNDGKSAPKAANSRSLQEVRYEMVERVKNQARNAINIGQFGRGELNLPFKAVFSTVMGHEKTDFIFSRMEYWAEKNWKPQRYSDPWDFAADFNSELSKYL